MGGEWELGETIGAYSSVAINMAPCQLVWQEPKFAGLKMDLQPVYSPNDVSSPAYHLRYTWSGWQSSYYAGTFGDYDMDAVRRSG